MKYVHSAPWCKFVAALTIVCITANHAAAVEVFSSFNGYTSHKVASPTGQPRAAARGTFDIHAGAHVSGGPQPTQVKHIPAQTGANLNHFPTKEAPRAWKVVGVQKNAVIIGGYALRNRPPMEYATAEKDFSRVIPFITTPALRTRVVDGKRTTAEAEARIRFDTAADGSLTVTALGSYSRLNREGTLSTGYSPQGMAGTLVNDPLEYVDAGPGDVVSGQYQLMKDDFEVHNDDELGFAGASLEIGTNALGLSPGPLGTSDAGLPLLLHLELLFGHDGDAYLAFDSNPALNVTYSDPEMGGAPIVGDVDNFLIDRLLEVLIYDSAESKWTLSRDVALFEYSFVVPSQAIDPLLIDVAFTQAAVGIPEPSALVLGSLGTIGWFVLRRRRRLSAGIGELSGATTSSSFQKRL